MTIEGFTDLERTDAWSFFGISLDYENGTASIYLKVFDQANSAPIMKSFAVEYPNFSLNESSRLVIAGVEKNPYFESISGFIGEIANIEMAKFYTNSLAFMWAGYSGNMSKGYNSVLLEFIFDIYSKTDILRSYGNIERNFVLTGEYEPLFL